MLCYILMLFNLHCPNKVYGKDCQSNKCEIHQGDKCLGSWLGLCKDISSPKGTGQTRNTTPPREKASWHKEKKKKKPASITQAGRIMSWRECFDFWRSVSSSYFTGGITCRELPAAQQQVKSWHYNPGLILNSDIGRFVKYYTTTKGLKNLAVNLLTQRKVKNWNTASGLNINCSGGWLSSG